MSRELLERLGEAREAIRDPLGEADLDLRWRRLERRRRRRNATRAMAVAAVLALGVVGAFAYAPTSAPIVATSDKAPAVKPDVEDPADLRLPDGSTVVYLTAATEVVPREVTSTRIDLDLVVGSARFAITRRPERELRVAIDDASVSVLGTQFVVTRLDDDRFRVEVEEGRVSVRHAGDEGWDEVILTAGESIEGGTRWTDPEPTPTASNDAHDTRRPRPRVDDTWRLLMEQGDYDAAYEAMRREGMREDDVGDLLLAADAARLSGHRGEAIELLRTVQQHRDDPRTSLGSFTLGRMLLRERPHEAAEAFGLARRLDPDSSLAQDALAREVEAWYLAGRPERARELATEYVRRWPDGLRVDSVRRLGGLDPR